jgi:predicted aspartyl protease
MIRGYFRSFPGGRRPFIVGKLSAGAIDRDIHFLIDTGADVTVLAPTDARAMSFNLRRLPRQSTTGIGGSIDTALMPASIELGSRTIPIELRIIAPLQFPQGAVAPDLPSLLGRDVLSHFGLYIEERRGLVLLFEPGEADALVLP